MGNSVSSKASPTKQHIPRGRVILWDGSVREFEPPLTAAELMLDHPQQAVVEFSSAIDGKRPSPLPADSNLEASKLYLMLPIKRGLAGKGTRASSLSGDEIRRVISAANSIVRSPSPASSSATISFLPLFARVCVSNPNPNPNPKRKRSIVERREIETTSFCEEYERKKKVSFVGIEERENDDDDDVYGLSRTVSGRFRGNWKPTLDTIEEKVFSNNYNIKISSNDKPCYNKVSHWLF